MPAINVARTDTFEQQRVKINEIATSIFNVTQGGSDLSTGNLKLGDGTRLAPSLAFTSDAELGIYRPALDTIGFVANTKRLFDISDIRLTSYKDFVVQKNNLETAGLLVSNTGSGYDEGDYTEVPFIGGTGDGGEATVTVVGFAGTVLNVGANYVPGQNYTGIDLIGGNGTGATCEFNVPELLGGITNAGSGYPPGSYTAVPATGGSGTGATFDVTVTGTTNLSGSASTPGSGYTTGSYNAVDVYNVPRQTYVVTVIGDGGVTPYEYVIDGVTRPTLTLEIGNTYRFDISDSSVGGHPFYFRGAGVLDALPAADFTYVAFGVEGNTGAFVDLVIHDTASAQGIGYECSQHAGMGNNISVVSGSTTTAGRGATADVVINANGELDTVSFTQAGTGYGVGDQIMFIDGQIGGGTGAVYTISTVSYTSSVTNVAVNSSGQNYLVNDVLGISSSFFGGFGSGFAFTSTTSPGTIADFAVSTYGSGYSVGDLLSLPTGVSGLTTVLPGSISGINTTLTAGQSQITIADTSTLTVGMNIFNGQGDVGFVAQGATIQSIDSATTLTMSFPADSSGAASLTFSSPNLTDIVLTSVTGITIGDTIVQTGGTGTLAAGTTVSNVDAATLTVSLSTAPTAPGTATLSFQPAFGVGTTAFSYRVDVLGAISQVEVTEGGNGYSVGDLLTISPTDLVQPNTRVVKFFPTQTLTFSGSVPTSAVSVGQEIKKRDGSVASAILLSGTTILAQADSTYTGVAATGGSGTGLTLDVTRDTFGNASVVVGANAGFGYVAQETVTVAGNLVGGSSPADDLSVQVDSVTSFNPVDVVGILTSGSNITSVVVADTTQGVDTDFAAGNNVIFNGSTANTYSVATATAIGTDKKIFIDDALAPDLTLYVGDSYLFDLSDASNASANFALSAFEGGDKAPSVYTGFSTTLDDTSLTVTLANVTNLVVGMEVTATGNGTLATGTKIASIDSATQVTLDTLPTGAGTAILTFTGSEYLDGVKRESNSLTLKVTANTPTLYYYDQGANGDDDAGFRFTTAATLTPDPNNPRSFGSGAEITVQSVVSTDIVKSDVNSGELTAINVTATGEVAGATGNISGTLTAPDIAGTDLAVTNINNAAGGITLTTAGSFLISSNVDIFDSATQQSTLSISLTSGDLSTQGELKTFGKVSVNDQLEIETNEFRSLGSNDLILKPAPGRIANVNTDSAIRIPVGNTAARPPSNQLVDGLIRYNTETQQYEGYNGTNSAWSSLGGVRDLDGNTYIKAEETVGANDNTLWFINDNINTLKVTPTALQFVNMRTISSYNVNAPAFTQWTANTPVTVGQFLAYRNNVYEVTQAGVTASSGNEPTHTTGAQPNNTAELTWNSLAVAAVEFNGVEEVRVGPLGDVPLVVSGELRFLGNVMSSDISDIIIRPNPGKKLKVDAPSSLVIPVGADTQRGAAETGSIRFNTTSSQFEGYDNNGNWGSLGGVKDVDQNTYIIPETAPGQNENILYFYNDGSNTLQLTTTALDFFSVDTIRSQTSNQFEITANLMTFNSAETTLDNTSVTTTFLHTSKQYFDLGLSAGLTVDPVLRLDNQGDVYFNTTFGTGNFNGVKVFDGDLKEFELNDVRILTEDITLVKGTTNNGSSTIYASATDCGAKVVVVAKNPTSGDKEFFEFGVIDNGSDVFHTEYGNVRTGTQLIIPTFEYTATNEVKINVELGPINPTESVNITFVSNVTKN